MGEPTPTIYFITLTTYGTWLHGDPRGSIDRKGQTHKSRYLSADPELEEANRRRMKHLPLRFDGSQRRRVRLAIEQDCDYRERRIIALNVRTNHVHLIVTGTAPGTTIMQQVKSRATRELRENGLISRERPVWTTRGDCKVLRDQTALENARQYVNERQGPDLPEE